MNISSFRNFTDTRMIICEDVASDRETFRTALEAIGSYIQVNFPMFVLPFRSLKIFRVINYPYGDENYERDQYTTIVDSSETMAVDRFGNLFINERFLVELWESNQKRAVVGVIIHEIMHVIYAHVSRDSNSILSVRKIMSGSPDLSDEQKLKLKDGVHHMCWNFAIDYIVNWYITQLGDTVKNTRGETGMVKLPDSGLFAEPGTGRVPLKELKPDVYILDDTGKLRSPEEVYILLIRSGFWKIADRDGSGGSSSESSGGEKTSGGRSDDMSASEADAGQFDDHVGDDTLVKKIQSQGGTPANVTPEEWKNIQAKSANIMKQAMSNRVSGSGGGTHMIEPTEGTVNWKQELKRFLKPRQIKTRDDWSNPRRRPLSGGLYLPKKKPMESLELPPAVVAIDTSGSTSHEQPQFLGEVINLIRIYKTDVRVLLWDDVVGKDITITHQGRRALWGNTGEPLVNEFNPDRPFEVTGGGGTSLSSVADYLTSNSKNKPPEIVIYLTDGYVESDPLFLPTPGTKNLVVLTAGGTDSPFVNDKQITVVKMV
jgi:predicted metal-dependent peptidase